MSWLVRGTKPATVAPSGYRNNEAANLTRIGSLGSDYAGIAANGAAGIDTYDPQYQDAVRQRTDYLSTDPYTDQRDTSDLARSTRGAADAYSGAVSRISARLQARGIGGGVEAGALTGVETARAQGLAGAENDLAYKQIGARDNRSAALLQLLGGVRQTYGTEQREGLAGQQGIYSNLVSGYGNLAGSDEQRMAQNEASRVASQQAQQQALLQLLQQGGQIYGMTQGLG